MSFSATNTALILIDHQVGTLQLVRTAAHQQVRTITLALAKAALHLNLPVVLTSSQEDRAQGPLWPELAALLPDAHARRIQRQGLVDAWADPAFEAAVRATGRDHLIMAGLTTDVCLVFPTIQAVRAGFAVQAVLDASGSPFELSEALARQRMRDAGVVLTTANTLIAELASDWSTPAGQKLINLLFSDILPPIGPTAGGAA